MLNIFDYCKKYCNFAFTKGRSYVQFVILSQEIPTKIFI